MKRQTKPNKGSRISRRKKAVVVIDIIMINKVTAAVINEATQEINRVVSPDTTISGKVVLTTDMVTIIEQMKAMPWRSIHGTRAGKEKSDLKTNTRATSWIY